MALKNADWGLISEISALSDRVHESTLSQRLPLWIYGISALVAAILALAGIYGVTSYGVSQRTQKIGVRMALGAQRSEVMGMVIGHALRLVLFGLVPGFLGAIVLGHILESMQSILYDVSAADPLTMVCVPLLLTAAAILACCLPSYKATRIDPMTALRCE